MIRKKKGYPVFVSAALVVLMLSGCATRNEKFAELDKQVYSGNLEQALQMLSDQDTCKLLYSPKRDMVLYHLDKGVLSHYAHMDDQAIEHLTQAERLIEENYTKSVTQSAGSYLLNDTVTDYAGEAYEDLYLNAFKALSFARKNDFDGTYVEIRRMGMKLNLLTDKYRSLAEQYNDAEESKAEIEMEENPFYNSALARYLGMVVYRADGNIDSARIDRDKISEAFRNQAQIYDFEQPDFSSALEPAEGVKLNVVGFSGLAPIKKANTLYIRTVSNGIGIFLVKEGDSGSSREEKLEVIPWPGMKNGFFFKFQLPYMKKQGTAVESAEIYVDGEKAGEMELLESLENAAYETFQLKKKLIYIKTITRTVVKGVAAQITKEAAKKAAEDQIGGIGGMVAGLATEVTADVAVNASEKADLRSSRYFPSHAFVGEVDVEPGEHTIRIDYLDGNGSLLDSRTVENRVIQPGMINLISTYVLH